MKRLLKDGSNGSYYDGNGAWVADEKFAHNFKDTSEAIRAFQKLKKENIWLILRFEDSRFDVTTPLGRPEPPAGIKNIKSNTIIIGTVLPMAMEAIRAVSTRS